eukprot:SAG31_NODE_22551_length_523_cov_0.724057_3_plen_73_part_01
MADLVCCASDATQNGKEFRHFFLIPAFFHTLYELQVEQRRDVRLVIRTFGTDGPEVVEALRCFCDGKHPEFPL